MIYNVMELDYQQVLSILPDRAADAHKGNFGKLLLLCGSRGYTGAAYLAAMGALRSGAGLVFLGVPESIYQIEAIKLNEAIVFALPDDSGKLSAEGIEQILSRLPQMDAVLIGPGLGQSAGTFEAVRTVLQQAACPVVLDADGINLIAAHKDIVRERTGVTVLTPHAGEFARLGGQPGDRTEEAIRMAKALGCILVLKGSRTVITDGVNTYINHTGNPGMAVGGSGDVLAGMVTALIGQGLQPLQATACAVWIHGKAGDLCAADMGQYGMLPTDMLNVLPRLFK